MHLTRAVLGLFTAGLVALTAACGSSAPTPSASSAGDPSAAAQATTRTVQTAHGAIQVPAEPKRVVSLLNTTAAVLELGITPVAIIQEAENDYSPEDWAKVKAIPVIGSDETSINYEQLAQLQPDLIVSTQRREEDFGYDKLSAIAPTAFFVTENPADVRKALPEIADALGKKDAMAGKIAEYEAKIAEIKSKYSAVLEKTTWDYVEGGPEGFVANSPVSWPGLFMEEAGLKFSKVATDERANRGVRLSYEQISQFKDTSVLLYGAQPDGNADPATQKLLDQGSWKLLPAVKDGHVYPLKYGYQYSYKGVLEIIGQLDAILAKLA
ncbi:ABC transporter substrate-binding protein [Streptosporangium saharense]|uniref:Iron complex transport system substrate-binding protein n=1 Tax=Streptosporangium saharense TaxID=1706840 RepID=A0A7W7QLA8_9ACTN|nr:ABC transporter substrate-binding protein [Streptosporangium saharense]MBB4915666.1 iron complex transport system substrate-binding protein [Streptosporangium saharense]